MFSNKTLGVAIAMVGMVLLGTEARRDPKLVGISFADYAMYSPIAKNGANSRIYQGSDAGLNEFPFVAYLADNDGHICTASLIDRWWVLTAAHCLNIGATYVVLGAYDRSNDSSTEQKIPIAEEIIHPNNSFIFNDIGLIRLARRANVRPDAVSLVAPLASARLKRKFLANRKLCKTLGWGLMRYDNGWSVANKLQQLDTVFVDPSEAEARGYFVLDGILRAEADYADECEKGGSCFGDSGGPIVCKNKGLWVQVGITSFGSRADGCVTGVAGLADVQYYIDWVLETISA